jgi:hypothetical protein
MPKLSKAQLWARERFLLKGFLVDAISKAERAVLAKGTLPIESRLLTLAQNHLLEMLREFDKNQTESKKQYLRLK